MSTTTWTSSERRLTWLGRAADYAELAKLRIGVMVLGTVAAAAFVGSWGQPEPVALLAALLGTALVASSASAANQWLEWHVDAHMPRTCDRPLPAGRLSSQEVIAFTALTLFLGFGVLAIGAGWRSLFFAAATWFMYVAVYTPLKRHTAWNTVVGAIAGAMPVAIGWVAVGGTLDVRVMTIFMLLFLWQFPHFMAIAWIYREHYRLGGLRMASVVDPSGHRCGVQAVLGAMALLPVGLIPALGTASSGYALCACGLTTGQLACAVLFCMRRTDREARRLLAASLIYLPAMLLLLAWLPWA